VSTSHWIEVIPISPCYSLGIVRISHTNNTSLRQFYYYWKEPIILAALAFQIQAFGDLTLGFLSRTVQKWSL